MIPDAVTHHTVVVGGRTLAYTARAGSIPLRNAAGDETAQVFSVAYTLDGADRRTRPVTFVWNGGPGSSTMWLHMASFGPVRVAIPSNATPPAPGTPYGAESRHAARPHRSGLHRRGRHGLQPDRRQGNADDVLRHRRGRRRVRQLHPRVDDAQRSLGLAEVPVRRVVRHDARRRRRRPAAGPRDGDRRRRAAVVGARLQRASTTAAAPAKTTDTSRSCRPKPRSRGTITRCRAIRPTWRASSRRRARSRKGRTPRR